MAIKQDVDKLIQNINHKAGKKAGIAEIFGSNVFNDVVMKKMLPKATYAALKKVQAGEAKLTREVADVVAEAMMGWAISKGATHYTHWQLQCKSFACQDPIFHRVTTLSITEGLQCMDKSFRVCHES
jgi:glutamine synthetase type III